MKGKEKNKICPKNYFLLALLFFVSIAITLYFCNWYHVYENYQKETPVIRGVISEITDEELDHYILENPTTFLYICTAQNMICRNYEKTLKEIIIENSLQNQMVYLNLSDSNSEEFIHWFNEQYPYRVLLTDNYPALVVFEDGKIKTLLQGSATDQLTAVETKQFLEMNRLQD